MVSVDKGVDSRAVDDPHLGPRLLHHVLPLAVIGALLPSHSCLNLRIHQGCRSISELDRAHALQLALGCGVLVDAGHGCHLELGRLSDTICAAIVRFELETTQLFRRRLQDLLQVGLPDFFQARVVRIRELERIVLFFVHSLKLGTHTVHLVHELALTI